MKKRILWLLNHTTLREFEVPMLIEMGYEVFTPKIYQWSFGDLSASVTWEYDSTLTIPLEDLAYLNECNMYADQLPARAIEIMNKYFDMAIFGPCLTQVRILAHTFKGIMILQAFGLAEAASYTRLFGMHSISLLEDILRLKDRFWFGATYENLPEVECDFFKKQYVYLPIGLKHDRVEKIWTGGDKRILFIGPKINTNSYYRQVYENFKRDFGMLPHVIGGAQLIPVPKDPAVLGFLPKEQYEYNMRHLAAMYYHSREPRHLHYHPLEAVANGMPLVFMAGGMLDHIGGDKLPGRCKTVSQARKMLRRLSEGDHALAERIVERQGVLLDVFRKDFCKQHWQKAFANFEQLMERQASKKNAGVRFKAKIAIVLPKPYLGGVLNFSVLLALAIQKGAHSQGDDLNVVFYYPENPIYQNCDGLRPLWKAGVQTQTFRWKKKDSSWFNALATIKGYDSTILPNEGYVIEDGIQDLQDFDYVIFTADQMPMPLFATTKHAIVVHDAIQRYLPEMFDFSYEALRQVNNRKADHVLVTTPYMRDVAVGYYGIDSSKIVSIPPLYLPVKADKSNGETKKGDYFIWPTNASQHKNHKKALAALKLYYARGGTLKCYMTGATTENFVQLDNGGDGPVLPYEKEIGDILRKSSTLRKNIIIKGELEKEVYLRCLQKAQFVFHPGFADNGNGSCVDALQLGVPAASSQYPPMEYMNERLGACMTMFDPHDPEDIADKLLYMEKNAEQLSKRLPDAYQVEKFTIDGQYQQIYDTIRAMVRGY